MEHTSRFGCVLLPVLASYSFTYFTFCQAIALHNVSYYTHIHIICPFNDTLYSRAYKNKFGWYYKDPLPLRVEGGE
jgi:hypothetical protein